MRGLGTASNGTDTQQTDVADSRLNQPEADSVKQIVLEWAQLYLHLSLYAHLNKCL